MKEHIWKEINTRPRQDLLNLKTAGQLDQEKLTEEKHVMHC